MKSKKIKNLIVFITCLAIFSCSTVFATAVNKPNINDLIYKFETEVQDPTKSVTTDYIAALPEAEASVFIGKIVFYMLVVANILAFISFIGSGIMMIISQGNDEMLKKAKNIFTYTIFGMLICATALAITMSVTRFNFFNP